MSARGMNVVSSARRAERQPTGCRKVKTEPAVVERSYGVQQLEPGRAAPSPVERGRRQGMPRPHVGLAPAAGVGSALRASSGAAIGSGAWAARAAACRAAVGQTPERCRCIPRSEGTHCQKLSLQPPAVNAPAQYQRRPHFRGMSEHRVMCDECADRSDPKPPSPPRCLGCAQPMKFVRRTQRFGGLPDMYIFHCRGCGEWHTE
jgi:hypothetical protein